MSGQQQQQQGDNSLDFLWTIGFIIGAIILTWYLGKTHIVSAVFYVRLYEMKAVAWVLDTLHLSFLTPNLHKWMIFVQKNINGQGIDFSVLADLSTVVGKFTRYILSTIILGVAVRTFFSGASSNLCRVFDVMSLRASEQENWPSITPILKTNLVNQKLDDGPWAMTMSSLDFCQKHKLVDIIEEGKGKYTIKLKKGAAYNFLSLQIGPKWSGVNVLPMHLKALFAIFAARINGDKAEKYLDQLSISSGGNKFNYEGIEELLKKYSNSKGVIKIINSHAYITTVMASMLQGARILGVLASADFLWLKPIDRRMWYMLNTVGRQTAVTEICGAYAHWMAEKKMGMPLQEPLIDEAMNGLEMALGDILYKPKDN